MRTNMKTSVQTHEGAPAIAPKNALHQLRRAVSACFLWEDQFYESGVQIADRISQCVAETCRTKHGPNAVLDLAIEARERMNLRHAPLSLIVALCRQDQRPTGFANGIERVIQRADEMGELIALYWKDGRKPLPAAMKRGIAKAFAKFDAYALAKYDRDGAVKMRDVLRLVHPKPADDAQAALWKGLIDGSIASPDTWEVALSAGGDKKETFERLLREGKLGYLALLRNLRNMEQAGVEFGLVRDAILARKGAQRVLPFRYVAAARAAVRYEPALDEALCASIEATPMLDGQTIVLVDVSGSMDAKLSSRSDLTRMDAAAALASIIPGNVRMFSFSERLIEVPPRRGMAGIDAIVRSQPHNGTWLGRAVAEINRLCYDRLIVVTDEQSHDAVPAPNGKGYMINVASAQNGVGYGNWTRINGFSESVLRYIAEIEA